MELTRRPAQESDIPFLLRLRRESMDGHLEAMGASTSEADHLARLKDRFECAEVLLQEGRPVGLLKVSRDNSAWRVIQIQLAAELRGQGLGAKLLDNVIRDAVAAGASLTLGVLKANPARSLYRRLGFVEVSESASEYEMRYAGAPSRPR
jgi:ribosomal protein S18 acetylase RimI-like enzyme